MSDGTGAALTILFALGMLICRIMGAHETGYNRGCEQMQQEAIDHGFAEYDTKSGEWKWKGDESK